MVTPVKRSSISISDILKYVSLSDISRGDGLTDCTSVLLAAITAGYAVFIPPGIFLIRSITIPDNSIIFGVGNKSQLKVNDLTNSVALTVGSGVKLANFLIDGNKNNQVGGSFHGIQFVNSSYSTAENVKVQNTRGDGFNITGTSDNVDLLKCHSTGFTGNGILISQGSNIDILQCKTYSSDASSNGDGVVLASSGSAITGVTIADLRSTSNVGRGLALVGNGSKNVTNVCISNVKCLANTGHNIHLINTDTVSMSCSLAAYGGADGVRLEGDVQNVRSIGLISKNNSSYGMREVVSGATPNFNKFIYSLVSGNGNNTVTVVGGSSAVVA